MQDIKEICVIFYHCHIILILFKSGNIHDNLHMPYHLILIILLQPQCFKYNSVPILHRLTLEDRISTLNQNHRAV